MTVWTERPHEEANLLNPAFCCLGMTAAIAGYQAEANQGLPLGLAYMILPITLHKPTRDLLPRNRRTSLPMWIQDNASVRVLFHERLISLKPFTREAILFGCSRAWITVQNNASLVTDRTEAALRRACQSLEAEPRDCVLKAIFVGRWLATAGTPATVMALWGIQP
ncbi:MAG TPA: DUF6521 family protein [Phycisphaerae bacterium]|jgi:hypothetical protein|nr:DUF6521 family protein [Phycisphaerae bacterium]